MGNLIREQIGRNLLHLRLRIEQACKRVGRDPESVRLIAVVKYARLEWVRTLVELGVVDLAESRPQQLEERVPLFPPHICWHLIGHLQNNKVRKVLPLVRRIHSVDSEKLHGTILRIGSENNDGNPHPIPDLLLEVNVSGEESKQGFSPAQVRELWGRLEQNVRSQIRGLMTMAPNTDSLDDARRTFAGLRELRDELNRLAPEHPLTDLSMGMTGDFEVGIEEGATEIRIGSALFEGLSDEP
ncbi:MAG: YggS family pyridoxal phosphate-dependent enzyme [Planctomycetaceae bacterium]|nr:YggS family pyridoxal phosphate-dependent enzyme [Planctomycetaceae bacterium]